MYICKHFIIQELVPQHVYEERGEKAWELLDERALRTLDLLRSKFGAITVNNYHVGGSRNWSGLRTPGSPYYSKYSQHTFGRAVDCLFKETTAEAVRNFIIDNKESLVAEHINSIELGTSWLHFDVRNAIRIKMFYP